MTQSNTQTPALRAPVAPRHPHSFTNHGITVVDDYAWLKDAKWQEVLRDPSILDADIRTYLEAENGYTESLLGHTATLQKKLVAEMRGRIKEDDSSVPAPDGPFAYLRKFREGGQHEMYGRTPRDGGDVQIVLENGEAESEILMLQGRPIAEPVAQHGPFVMNTRAEIQRAVTDYQRTRFGGWPWPSDAPVHDRQEGRFAKHADGKVERVDRA